MIIKDSAPHNSIRNRNKLRCLCNRVFKTITLPVAERNCFVFGTILAFTAGIKTSRS